MRDQHLFPKRLTIGACDHLSRNARQIAILAAALSIERKRNQRGPASRGSSVRIDERYRSQMPSLPFSESKVRRLPPPVPAREIPSESVDTVKPASCRTSRICAIHKYLHPGRPAFRFEHFRNVGRRAVAEKLAQGFFVVGNSVFFDQRNKIRRRVPRQRGLGKVRIRGNEILRPAINIREIAAPAAGNQNLFADAFGMFEHSHAPPALARLNRAHQSRSATAQESKHQISASFISQFSSCTQFVRFCRRGMARHARHNVLARRLSSSFRVWRPLLVLWRARALSGLGALPSASWRCTRLLVPAAGATLRRVFLDLYRLS